MLLHEPRPILSRQGVVHSALVLLPTILPSFLIEKGGYLKMMELVLGTKNNRDIEYLFGLRPQYLPLKTCL